VAGAVAAVAFDVNETLLDLEPLRPRLEQAGAPGHLLELWFASTLRDGIALAAAGGFAEFPQIGLGVLETLLARAGHDDPRGAAEHVLAGFGELPLHEDVLPAIRVLRAAGVRTATLTNGSAALAEQVLERGGVAHLLDARLTVAEVGRWKPAPEPYLHAAWRLGVRPGQLALVAVHPWDLGGAARAGLRTGWLNRRAERWPAIFPAPDAEAADLPALAEALVSL
jgi:2-haloacid dehalogenase